MDYETIDEAVLGSGDTLALSFARNVTAKNIGGTSTETLEHDVAFFEIQGHEHLSYRPLKPRDDQGNRKAPLAPVGTDAQSATEFSRLHDSRGRDIVRVESSESPWHITHFAPSVLQKDVRIYPRIPSTERHPGWPWANQSQPSPKEDDPFGYMSGAEMEYENPPSALETFGFLSGDRSRLEYAFDNGSRTKVIDPTIKLQGRSYRLAPVTDVGRQTDIVERAIAGEEGTRLVTWGTISDAYTISLPDDWKDVGAVRRVSGGYFDGDRSTREALEEEVTS